MPKKKYIFIPLFFLAAVIILGLSAKNFLMVDKGCACTNIETATGNFENNQNEAFFDNQKLTPPLAMLPEMPFLNQKVLGDNTGAEKWIEVNLTEQKLRAWEGNNLFLESLISSGKTFPTPTGEFRIWVKFKYTKMSGGSKENKTYYYLPNVPYTMYFYNSFGLHGTYWHNNFGHPMSHGCVNLPTPIAEKLYYWTNPLPDGKNMIKATAENPGTRVVIHN
jgi:hypothetical protein